MGIFCGTRAELSRVVGEGEVSINIFVAEQK